MIARYENRQDAYARYLEASDRILGPLDVGGYGVREGKLVKKFTLDEFDEKLSELEALSRIIQGVMISGATVDDGVYQEIKDLAHELLMRERETDFDW